MMLNPLFLTYVLNLACWVGLQVRVDGPLEDLHPGVDGGVVVEPLADLMAVLANLVRGAREK